MTFEDIFFSNTSTSTNIETLPMFKEMAIDFSNGEVLIGKDNDVIILEGNEALKVWIWKTLLTDRFKYKAYSNSYGNELKKEIGFVYDRKIKEQLINSEINDCLMVNPYIKRVYNFENDWDNSTGKLKVYFSVQTIYGVIGDNEVIV